MGLPFRGFYSASKSALDKVTEAIRYEITPFNIQATSIHLGDIQTDIANNRLNSTVSIEYETTFKRVFQSMNQHVNQGKNPKEVAIFLDKLIHKKELKPHYYFGSFGQKSSILLKKFLPQTWFERIIKKYANL